MNNDLAIIKLTRQAKLGPSVQPACLPSSSSFGPSSNTKAYIAGWGMVAEKGSAPVYLQNTEVNYYPTGYECRKISQFNSTSQICAGDYSGGKDACKGDSGGPLFIKDKDKFVLIGITSYGTGCARPKYPG